MAAIEAADRAHLNDRTVVFAFDWLTVHSCTETSRASRSGEPVNRA
jgi:hypothetical protein